MNIQLPEIGQAFEGGYLAGVIKRGEQTCAVITAPKEFELDGEYGNYGQDIEGARSTFDCAANTKSIVEAGSDTAKKVSELEINGFSDWVVPSRDALEVCYRNLKPTDDENYCSYRDGDNPSSVPPGHLYTDESPAQTTAELFKAGGEQAFDPVYYLTSTQYSATSAYVQAFEGGHQYGNDEDFERRVRPVRILVIS